MSLSTKLTVRFTMDCCHQSLRLEDTGVDVDVDVDLAVAAAAAGRTVLVLVETSAGNGVLVEGAIVSV